MSCLVLHRHLHLSRLFFLDYSYLDWMQYCSGFRQPNVRLCLWNVLSVTCFGGENNQTSSRYLVHSLTKSTQVCVHLIPSTSNHQDCCSPYVDCLWWPFWIGLTLKVNQSDVQICYRLPFPFIIFSSYKECVKRTLDFQDWKAICCFYLLKCVPGVSSQWCVTQCSVPSLCAAAPRQTWDQRTGLGQSQAG